MIYVALAAVSGLFTVISRMVNASLATAIGSLRGSLVNHAVGAVGAGLLIVVGVRTGVLVLSEVPWIYFVGGCLGVIIVTVSNYAVQHIGAALFAILILVGQLLASTFIDHFSLLGDTRIPMTLPRLAGVVILMGGALLVLTDQPARQEPESL